MTLAESCPQEIHTVSTSREKTIRHFPVYDDLLQRDIPPADSPQPKQDRNIFPPVPSQEILDEIIPPDIIIKDKREREERDRLPADELRIIFNGQHE